MFRWVQGGTPGKVFGKTQIGLASLAALLVWAAAPGRSPSRVEEFLLSPFALIAGLTTLFGSSPPLVTEPAEPVRRAWRALREFEEQSTHPGGGERTLFADVLDRRRPARTGRSYPADLLLLSLPLEESGLKIKAPCLVQNRLVGFIDRVSPPVTGRVDRLLCWLGLKGQARFPTLAWARLLHSPRAPWPEPPRLAVWLRGGGVEDGAQAIVGPGKRDDKYPLRLFHPALLERPTPGTIIYSAPGGLLSEKEEGYLVGQVMEDSEFPDISFVAPALRPEQIHCVQVLCGGKKTDRSGARRIMTSPLERGSLLVAKSLPFPVGDLRGRRLLAMIGSAAGVREGAAAVKGWSLMGVVASVGPFHSHIAMPGDGTLSLLVIVTRGEGSGRVHTLMRGRMNPAAIGKGRLRWLPDRAGVTLKRGDLVWTAPGGLDLPKGLFVGEVGSDVPPGKPVSLLLPSSLRRRPSKVGLFRFGITERGIR